MQNPSRITVAVSLAVLVGSWLGCTAKSGTLPPATADAGSPKEAGASTEGGASTTTPDAAPASTDMVNASLACVDVGVAGSTPLRWSAQITANTVERCILAGDTLTVGLLGSEFFNLRIDGLTGPGTYSANAGPDEGTFVSLRAKGGAEPGSSTDVSTGTGECPSSCTITVTEAKVKDAALGATGSFVANVDCPTLTGAAVGCVTCTPGGTVAKLVIPACEHDS